MLNNHGSIYRETKSTPGKKNQMCVIVCETENVSKKMPQNITADKK